MLFCVIRSHNEPGDTEIWRHRTCYDAGICLAVSCPGLLVIIWRQWATPCPVSRPLIITWCLRCHDTPCILCLATALTNIHRYHFSAVRAGPGSLGRANEIWYKLNIKYIFCCLSASPGQSALSRLLQEWWELLLSSIYEWFTSPFSSQECYVVHVHCPCIITFSLSVNGSEFEQLIEILYT